MEVRILGKEHVEGMSKGKPFSFDKAYVSYKTPAVEGEKVKDIFLREEIIRFSDVVVGGVYDIMVDFDGRIQGIELVG